MSPQQGPGSHAGAPAIAEAFLFDIRKAPSVNSANSRRAQSFDTPLVNVAIRPLGPILIKYSSF